MLINIDPSTGTVTRLDGQEENGLLKTCDRLKEELDGWLDYRKLAGKEERYGKVATQEFTHALMALSDLLTDMQGQLNEAEMAEFKSFCATCMAK